MGRDWYYETDEASRFASCAAPAGWTAFSCGWTWNAPQGTIDQCLPCRPFQPADLFRHLVSGI